MLEVKDIHTYYGKSHILQGVSLIIKKNEIVLLSGRNGVGKSTLLKSIMGLVPPKSGEIEFQGERISGIPTHIISQKGISFVPEERWIFQGLTVYENLKLAMLKTKDKEKIRKSMDRISLLFPNLTRRFKQEGTSLSGGEQQMLAIARGLISGPALMLIDEPCEGLMPILVENIMQALKEIQNDGVTILLVEQNVEMALEITDRCYLMDEGMIKFQGTSAEVRDNDEMKRELLVL